MKTDVLRPDEVPPPDPADPDRDRRRSALRDIVDLEPGQRLERLYLFDPVERRDVAFSLAIVTKRIDEDRLEMVAIGGRAALSSPPDRDFVRRARFPEGVLPRILEEFIDRGGVEEAGYREVPLDRRADGGADPVETLLDLLEPDRDPDPDRGPDPA